MTIENIELDCDDNQRGWIKAAIRYLPLNLVKGDSFKIVIVALGSIGACRLSKQYREREIIFLADWIFPPLGTSEEDPAGIFFITTVLHEIAHAVCLHKTTKFDQITEAQNRAQEDEADELAKTWFNEYVHSSRLSYLSEINSMELTSLVQNYAILYEKFLLSREDWHKEIIQKNNL